MTQKRDSPYIWVTWITKLVAGEDSCQWSAWFKTHHEKYPLSPSTATNVDWLSAHTAMLEVVAAEYRQRYPQVGQENQNKFGFQGRSGAVLAGKPDLVGYNGEELRICDVKTGEEKESHWVQMMIYVHFFPKCFPQLFKDHRIVGELRYKNRIQEVYPEEFAGSIKERVSSVLQMVASVEEGVRVPSVQECQWCKLTDETCPEKIDTSPLENRQMALGDF